MELEDALLLVAALALVALALFVVVVPFILEWRCSMLDAMLVALPFAHLDFLQGFKDCDAFVYDLALRVRGDIFQRFCKKENKVATAFAAAPLVGHAPCVSEWGAHGDSTSSV